MVAAGLRGLGLRRDDRVMLVMSDEVPMLTGILGAFRAGLVAVPVSTMFTGAELGKIMADSGARAVLATPEFADAVGQAIAMAPDVEHAVLAGDGTLALPDTVTGHTWEDLTAARRSQGDRSIAPTVDDSWALWLYTSGTTGLPKAAMHRHANIRHVCETYGAQVLGITPDDTTFSVAKMFFAYGIGNTVFFPFSVGATTVLEPRRPTPDVVRERLERDRPTLFFGVPTFYAALTASDLPADAFASRADVRVRRRAAARAAAAAVHRPRSASRSSTASAPPRRCTSSCPTGPATSAPARPACRCRATTSRCATRSATSSPADEPGALHVRGESIALGYWHRTDATRQVFQGEWLVTGDTYVRNDEGYYTCLGRNSDMLKAGGIWVSPAEVESRLLEHPAVREAAVVGVADADGLDKPVARGRRSATAPTRRSWWPGAATGLAHFKAPRRVVFVDDLPKTATGKLQRFKVRDLVAAEPGRRARTRADRRAGRA